MANSVVKTTVRIRAEPAEKLFFPSFLLSIFIFAIFFATENTEFAESII
ncbi:hypothetical protein ES703_100556 [subsurface metagenome]